MNSLALLLSLLVSANQNWPLATADQSKLSRQNGGQYLDCYTGANQAGQHIRLTTYSSDLSDIQPAEYFDDSISSCCFTGIWILYDKKNYNKDYFSRPTLVGWGQRACLNMPEYFDNLASSARYSGSPDGYEEETLTFYEEHDYMGEEQYADEDTPKFAKEQFGRSLILTGCSPWTLYERENFKGAAICVYPEINCRPSFFPDPGFLLGLNDGVASARKGCFSSKISHGNRVDSK